jgi:hypothetical protein
MGATGLLAGGVAVAVTDATTEAPADAATTATPDWIDVTAITNPADPTGANDSTAAFQAAIDSFTANTPVNAAGCGVVYVPAGNYKISSTLTCTTMPVYFVGDGMWATTVLYYGSGDYFRIYEKSTYGSRTKFGGGFVGITIDGTHATGAATGLHVGDLLQYELDLTVQNFYQSGSVGVHLDNNYYWMEQLFGRIYAPNCASHVVVFKNGAFVTNGSLKIRGNFGYGTSAVTSAALRLAGSGSVNNYPSSSGIVASMLDIGVECATKAGNHVPQTIVFGASGNQISNCYGALNFGAADTTFAASNNSKNIVNFVGQSTGDSTLPGQTNWVTYTGTALPAGFTGNVSFRFLPTGNEVMVSWGLAIASGTKVTSGSTIVTAASLYSAGGNKLIPANATGSGLTGNVYAPAEMSPGGAFKYLSPSYTSTGGSSWWFGQGVYTLSVG